MTSVPLHVGPNKRIHVLFLLVSIMLYFLIFYYLYTMSDSVIFNLTLTKKASVDAKLSDDRRANAFFGMFVTANGMLLLADFARNKVKGFASNSTFLLSLSLSGSLSSMALINVTTAVVGAIDNKLNLLNIPLPLVLSVQRSVSLEYTVIDVIVYNNAIIALTRSNIDSVKMLNLDDRVIWSTSSNSSGQPIFEFSLFLETK